MNEATANKVSEALAMLRARNFKRLYFKYLAEDQKLMRSRGWDDANPDLITNKVKECIEGIDPEELSAEDRVWWAEIMWFWHHHAISSAIWRRKDRALAQKYADLALQHQPPDHGNYITKLLWYLVYDHVDEAKRWLKFIPSVVERKTGRELIEEYERGQFF